MTQSNATKRAGIDPGSLGATTSPKIVSWTERDTILYALGVGAGIADLALTTENSHNVPQQVLPTYAVIAAGGFDALPKVGAVNFGKLLHGSQGIMVYKPLPASGRLSVVAEVSDLQDKGEGKNAIVTLVGRGTDPDSGELIAETTTTLVLRGQGGFGGSPGAKGVGVQFPDGDPDIEISAVIDELAPLIYRLSGDRNPLHSDPWFAREKAGFPGPIVHGLCTYGTVGRLLIGALCDGDTAGLSSIDARFTSPVFPGDTLLTSVWRTGTGRAVFRVTATGRGGQQRGVVLDSGAVQLNAASGAF